MKRTASRKSHSWWWDSHISPKNSRWLFENLEQMDCLVKEMLKLIEEEGDSFAKKAEMYYQRRPKLLSHVEDFYRMYRALAERYDNVTGELRKNMPSDLHSQSSGNGSDFGTEPASPSFSPSSDQTPESKKKNPKPFRRAAGFEVFLGSAASSDFSRKDSDDSPSSSSSESGSDSEDGKVVDADDNNTSGLNARIVQLEEELREVRVKLKEYEKGSNGQSDHLMNLNDDQDGKMGDESENQTVILEDEIKRLKETMEVTAKKFDDEISLNDRTIEEYKAQLDEALSKLLQEKSTLEDELNVSISDLKLEAKQLAEKKSILEIRILEQAKIIRDLKASAGSSERLLRENSTLESKVCSFMETEKTLQAKIQALQNRVIELESKKCEACTESTKLLAKLNQNLDAYKLKVSILTSEKDEFSARLSKSMDWENIHKANLQVLENRIRDLEDEKTEAFNESAKLIAELNQSLDIYKLKVDMLTSEKYELNARVSDLLQLNNSHEAKIKALGNQIRELEVAKAEACNNIKEQKDELNQCLDRYRLKVNMLTSEKGEVDARISNLVDSKSINEAKIQALEDRLREVEAAKAEGCNESAKQREELRQNLDKYKLKVDMLTSEKDEIVARVAQLSDSKNKHEPDIHALEERVRELEAAKAEACNESSKQLDKLNQSLDSYKLKVDMLMSEKDELNARVSKLMDDAKCRDDNSRNMAEHLHQLHIEHINLIKEIEEARAASVGLCNRVQELEGEVEKQRVLILDAAEGKREAIRQLCFSLEHYRDGYWKLRQMLQGHNRRLAIMAT